uniref:Uncharacterized protein n=1 Tax=Timema shepardi TaxID=629360 RepID=A0A7R9FY05_TIMSH|nr:unnamed protein product [Timema shepardi]
MPKHVAYCPVVHHPNRVLYETKWHSVRLVAIGFRCVWDSPAKGYLPGTLEASCQLVRQCGGEVLQCLVIMELQDLKGKEKVSAQVESFIKDVDQVHDMMDDIAEQQDVAKEISDAISNPVAFGGDVDEEELEAELEALEQEELDNQLLGVTTPTPDTLPVVPSAEPVAARNKPVAKPRARAEEDDEMLKELEAWAS